MDEGRREEILGVVDEFDTISYTLRSISRRPNQDRLSTRLAYTHLQAYRQGVSTEKISVPQADDPLDSECVANHYEELREEIAAAIPELEAEKVESRERAVKMLEGLLSDLPVEDGATDKRKIIVLKEALQSDVGSRLLAEVVGCSAGYPGNFKWDDGQEEVTLREGLLARKEERFSDSQKEQIKQRDGYECVRADCDEGSPLRVHHIAPVSFDGEGKLENGATLCKSCHDELHQDERGYGDDYASIDEFWCWAKPSRS